jgi:DNA-binding response OmpR family regulator
VSKLRISLADETLRKQKESKKTLLIALSGFGDEEDRQKAMLAGFDYHFTKPARIPELRKLVSTRI